MKLTGNQTLAAAGAIFFVLLFGTMWSVGQREPSPITAEVPAVAEAPPGKRVKARPFVTDIYAGRPRDDGEDSYTAALRDGFLSGDRLAAARASREARTAAGSSSPATTGPSAPDTAAATSVAVPSTTPTPIDTTPAVDTTPPDSKRTQLLAASSRRMVRLCERVTGSGPEMPELKGIATSVPDYSAPGWDAVLREAQKVLTYYGADTSGVWKGLAANDYMLRIARTADRTCGSSELATIVVEAIDPTALLLDPEALDRMMDEALRDL